MFDQDNSNVSSSTNAESESGCSTLVGEFLNLKYESDDNADDIGEYYFESDHLALKNNSDYRALIKTVAILQAQRSKTLQDIDTLLEAKDAALADPIGFVEKLRRGEDLNLPKPQKIVELPVIDWDKYSRSVNTSTVTAHKHMTRHNKPAASVTSPSPPLANDSNSGSSSNEVRPESDESTSAFTRNRSSTVPKSQTFNIPWSEEEQRRLEDLLEKNPPEAVEARRWEKIAKALGNRTPQQVASRIQKYFNKLAELRMPIPGRTPRMTGSSRRSRSHRHQRHSRFLFQRSTFLASREPPVFMSDFDDDAINYSPVNATEDSFRWNMDEQKDDEFIPPHLRDTEEYKELMYLKQLKKSKESNSWQSTISQEGFSTGCKCSRCGREPLLGRWWHCTDCPPHIVLNLCDDCSRSNYETSTHLSGHRVVQVGKAENSFDNSDYNYLDPNYMPAT